jgi:hypothetical protein
MSGDIGDILEAFEGPRTLRYFMVLLTIVVGVLVIGSVMSSLHGIHWIEDIGLTLAGSPMALLKFAGVLAVIALGINLAPVLQKYLN